MLQTRLKTRQIFIRSHAFGMCLVSAGQWGLATYYGDSLAAQIWMASLLIGVLFVGLIKRLTLSAAMWSGMALFTGVVWVAHVAVPLGAPIMVLYLAYSLTLFSLLHTQWVAILVIAMTISAPAVLVGLGYFEDAHRAVPSWMAAMWTLLVISLMANLQFSRSRHSLIKSLADLRHTRLQMLKVQEAQNTHRVKLMHASEDYRMEIDGLTMQMMSEARVTEDLRSRQDDKKSIVQAIHHDLKEPLRSIVSFTQLARRKLGQYECDPSLSEYLAFAEDGGRRMAVMLEDLMSYTNDADQERSVTVDLNELCDEVLKNLHDSIARTAAEVTREQLPVVEGQRTQLLQLVQNLLSNALKFSHPGVPPRVRISAASVSDGRMEISIADNGIGIPPNQIDKVFGLFNRAHAEQSYEGSGVGLALCRKIVIAHGGQIRVISAGVGTQFVFDLPIIREVQKTSLKAVGHLTYAE